MVDVEDIEEAEAAWEAVEMAEGSPTPVDTVSYRGFEVPVYSDDAGQQFWCVWDGEEVGFGSFNFGYEADVEWLIDQRLDVVKRFGKPYAGAKLEWFDNAGFRDLRLKYRGRVLKVFPTSDGFDPEASMAAVEAECESVLARAVKPAE